MIATNIVHNNTPTLTTTEEASLDLFVVINGRVAPEPAFALEALFVVGIPPD